MITTLFLMILVTIISSFLIAYLIVFLIRSKKRKQLIIELLPTITKPDVQSLFSKSKDKVKKKKEIVFFKSTQKNYGEYLQQARKQKWDKK